VLIFTWFKRTGNCYFNSFLLVYLRCRFSLSRCFLLYDVLLLGLRSNESYNSRNFLEKFVAENDAYCCKEVFDDGKFITREFKIFR